MNTPDGFDEFWSAYPRKVGKGAAVKSWVKQGLNKNASAQAAIVVALEWQVSQDGWLENGGRYIPHPSTWLNRWQWHDERNATVVRSYAHECPHTPRCGGRNECHVKQQIAKAKATGLAFT